MRKLLLTFASLILLGIAAPLAAAEPPADEVAAMLAFMREEEKLAHDVWYVDNASMRVDLRILLLTIRAVLGRDGVSADGHATMPEFMGET